MPLVPVIILLLGSTKLVPVLKMGVPHAMVIGAILSLAVTRKNPVELTKSFFDGMGDAYANIIGIIISVGVFVAGLNALGLIKALINWMLNSTGIVKIAATFGPFVLALISGSGDAATFAFNEAVTPHAAALGMTISDLGNTVMCAAQLGRTTSPIAGVVILIAGMSRVSPIDLVKRTCVPMVITWFVLILFLD